MKGESKFYKKWAIKRKLGFYRFVLKSSLKYCLLPFAIALVLGTIIVIGIRSYSTGRIDFPFLISREYLNRIINIDDIIFPPIIIFLIILNWYFNERKYRKLKTRWNREEKN